MDIGMQGMRHNFQSVDQSRPRPAEEVVSVREQDSCINNGLHLLPFIASLQFNDIFECSFG